MKLDATAAEPPWAVPAPARPMSLISADLGAAPAAAAIA